MNDPDQIIRHLVDAWCDRREYQALAIVLPAWSGNNGLTDADGWTILRDDLRHAYAICTNLPEDERDAIKRAFIEIDYALRNC